MRGSRLPIDALSAPSVTRLEQSEFAKRPGPRRLSRERGGQTIRSARLQGSASPGVATADQADVIRVHGLLDAVSTVGYSGAF
jgi:hypothetical protein